MARWFVKNDDFINVVFFIGKRFMNVTIKILKTNVLITVDSFIVNTNI